MKKLSLFLLLFNFWGGATVHADCLRVGACVDCGVKFDSPSELLKAPPLYWDFCQNSQSDEKIIYFVPSRIIPVIKNGESVQFLRKRSNGELLLGAKLNFYPWGNESGLSGATLLQSLKEKHSNLRFKPLPVLSYRMEFLGKWKDWMTEMKLTPINGSDFFRSMRLSVTFDPQNEKKVIEALKRDLGIIGQVVFTYKGFTKKGKEKEFSHTLPLHLGNLEL